MNQSPNPTFRRRAMAKLRSGFILLLAFGLGYSFHGCAPKSQWGVSSASWMPPDASDGAYGHGPTFIMGPSRFFYEYTISEERFRAEMKRRGLEVSAVLGEEFVPRYLMRHIRPNEFEGDDWHKYQEFACARITDGLIHEWSYEDQQRILAFDRKRNRAFLFFQIR